MSAAVRTRTGWSLARILESPEYRIAVELDELEAAFRLHEANYHDLRRTTAELVADDDEEIERLKELWSSGKRVDLERTWIEAGRLLHNYVASAITLVDHTRNHTRRLYGNNPFAQEYEIKKEAQLANSPVVRFVAELRNYNLHHRLPVVGGELSIDVEKLPDSRVVRSRVCLEVRDLLARGDWNKHSRKYLAAAGGWLPLDSLANDHMNVISPFYYWLRSRERVIHKNALRRHKRRIARAGAHRNGASGESSIT